MWITCGLCEKTGLHRGKSSLSLRINPCRSWIFSRIFRMNGGKERHYVYNSISLCREEWR